MQKKLTIVCPPACQFDIKQVADLLSPIATQRRNCNAVKQIDKEVSSDHNHDPTYVWQSEPEPEVEGCGQEARFGVHALHSVEGKAHDCCCLDVA